MQQLPQPAGAKSHHDYCSVKEHPSIFSSAMLAGGLVYYSTVVVITTFKISLLGGAHVAFTIMGSTRNNNRYSYYRRFTVFPGKKRSLKRTAHRKGPITMYR